MSDCADKGTTLLEGVHVVRAKTPKDFWRVLDDENPKPIVWEGMHDAIIGIYVKELPLRVVYSEELFLDIMNDNSEFSDDDEAFEPKNLTLYDSVIRTAKLGPTTPIIVQTTE